MACLSLISIKGCAFHHHYHLKALTFICSNFSSNNRHSVVNNEWVGEREKQTNKSSA